MTMDLAEALRAIAEADPEARVTMRVAVLREHMAPAEYTLEELAARYRRARSTIRDWCRAGRFPGARKLGREWRVPASGVAAFEAGAENGAAAPAPALATARPVDLGAWRRLRQQEAG
jgi:hypothetical protein